MKTLHVETGRHLYGGALQVLYLVSGLVERGMDTGLLAPADSDVAQRARELGLPTETFPFHGEGDVVGALRMGRLIAKSAPDLVHLHSRRGADTWGALAGAVTGTPAVLTRRVDNPEHGWVFGLKYGLYRHVIAISETIERVLLGQGLSPSKLSRVYSGVDVGEWSIRPDRGDLELEFDLPEGVSAAAMVAQFIGRKGHAVLLEALSILGDDARAPVVVLFGQGPLKDQVEAEAVRLGVSRHLRFAGFRADLSRWLGAFDFCVHPALMEGLGVAALQAGAAGLPVIGAHAGGIPEIVVHEETGLLARPNDPESLAECLRRIVRNEDQAKVWGMRARKRVADYFSVPAMVDGNIAVYEKVLSGR